MFCYERHNSSANKAIFKINSNNLNFSEIKLLIKVRRYSLISFAGVFLQVMSEFDSCFFEILSAGCWL